MKKLLCLLSIATLAITASAQIGQTNTPPPVAPSLSIPISLDFLTNIPAATDLTTATFGLGAGLVTKDGQLENLLKADVYLYTNYILSLEIQNASVASVVDSISLYGGYRKAWSNAELYGELGVRRTWETAAEPPSWQAVALLGAGWMPLTGGHVALFTDIGITTAPRGNIFQTSPGFEFRTGVKLFF